MSYARTSSIEVPVSPVAASEAIHPIARELGYTIADHCTPGDAEVHFSAKSGVFRAERQGSVRITGSPRGSMLEILVETAPPPENSGLLDGRRNQKSVDELTARIATALGAA